MFQRDMQITKEVQETMAVISDHVNIYSFYIQPELLIQKQGLHIRHLKTN
jgi:hypothetical protein